MMARSPPYNAGAEYYGEDRASFQVPGNPSAFHRLQPQLPEEASALADTLAGIEVAQSSRDDQLPHNKDRVVHAIEAAAAVLQDQASALRDQISENERLKSALRVREWESQNFRTNQGQGTRSSDNPSQDELQQYTSMQQFGPPTSERSSMLQSSNQALLNGELWAGIPHSSLIVHPNVRSILEHHHQFSSNGLQGLQDGSNFGVNGGIRWNLPDGPFSHTSSPTARSMTPIRLDRECEAFVRLQPGAVGNILSRQDVVKNAPSRQDEINQLKRVRSDCAVREMQLVHENHMLRERISELRLTIEKYQQKLMDATSRETAISQDLLQKNVWLTSDLRVADQELHFYAFHFMPLLAEYGMQPATRDPHSIVSGIKTLVQHLRDQQHREEEPHGLEIVPQASYLGLKRPLSPPSPSPLAQIPGDWDMQGAPNTRHPFTIGHYANENGRRSPFSAQTADPQHPISHGISMDYNSPGILQGNDPYADGDEESSATDEDPLPGITGLCINGDVLLGSTIVARGLSINGTKLCHFQWVRHHRDGSSFHIPGAAEPSYIITADDVDTQLSVECTPMDGRNRKGGTVQAFVDTDITLDLEMKERILGYRDSEQANFDVKLLVESPQDVSFEPALLSLKRSLYELKKVNGKRLVGSERYASESTVEIKVGKDSQCAIISNTGAMHLLDCIDNWMRDLLVLTMREFIKVAVERSRGKKKFWLK